PATRRAGGPAACPSPARSAGRSPGPSRSSGSGNLGSPAPASRRTTGPGRGSGATAVEATVPEVGVDPLTMRVVFGVGSALPSPGAWPALPVRIECAPAHAILRAEGPMNSPKPDKTIDQLFEEFLADQEARLGPKTF